MWTAIQTIATMAKKPSAKMSGTGAPAATLVK